MTAKTNSTTRRHILAAGAALAPGLAFARTKKASGADPNKEASMADGLAPELVNCDAQLKALFEEWQPIAREYSKACAEEAAADEAYCKAIYRAPQRARDGSRVARNQEIVDEVIDELVAEGAFKSLKSKRITAQQGADRLARALKLHMAEGETPESFLQYCLDETEKEERSKREAKALYRVDELREAIHDIVSRECEIGERMAKIQSDTIVGVGYKLYVAQAVAVDLLNNSIMADIRRLAGMPSAPKGEKDPFLMTISL